MARAMKKFSAGGAQGKYDRRMADIKKDFAKDSAGKSGRALEVLEAKRAQRIADAEDDRAKRMGTDRTATRKAEYEAEQRLSRTRRFGADKPAATPAAPPAKTTAPAAAPAAETAKAKPQSRREAFNEAFRAARKDPEAMKRGVFTFNGEKFSTKMAGEGRKASTGTGAGTAGSSTNNSAAASAAAAAKAKQDAAAAAKAKQDAAAAAAAKAKQDAAAKAKQDAAAKVTGPSTKRGLNPDSIAGMIASGKLFRTSDAFRKSQEAKYGKAKGGAVKKKETTMKYRSGGSTPPKPTAADRAADAKFRKSIKNLKPTPEQAAAIGRANRSSGYAKGGKVKKMAVGGMAPTTPTTPAANTAGGTVTRATPGNTLTGVPSPSAQMQASQPLVSRPRDPTPAPQTAAPPIKESPAPYKPVTPLQNVQNFIDRKYSSATPNLDKSAKSGSNETTRMAAGKDPASGPNTAPTKSTFDRNQALRDFNSVARTFLNQGVSNKELIQAQGQLRKLQMDNSSTPAQHQAAMQSIIARMNSLVPSKGAGAGAIKGPGGGLAKGGSTKAATKSGRALVKKSADTGGRAMKKYAKGGLVGGHKAANGIAKKGLTKGKQVKMNKGGACYAKGGSVRSIDGIATKGKTRCKGARK
jgi:hypothetical protein